MKCSASFKSQLSYVTVICGPSQEDLPSDELAKSTLQVALKLRLSLISSMLLSLRES